MVKGSVRVMCRRPADSSRAASSQQHQGEDCKERGMHFEVLELLRAEEQRQHGQV